MLDLEYHKKEKENKSIAGLFSREMKTKIKQGYTPMFIAMLTITEIITEINIMSTNL